MPELSIIVPVYKVEPYLPKCIDSILAQTFRDFELILIDDGSPDRCGEICDEYAAKDARIVVIHQENRGVSAARNAGMDIARGEYIGFVDSDDWIEPEMYETMINVSKKKGVDVVICGICDYGEDGEFIRNALTGSGFYTKDEMLKTVFTTPNNLGGGCCNKVFRHIAIKDVRYQEGIAVAEDWLFLFDSFKQCNGSIKIPSCLYNVLERQNSATRDNEIMAMYDIIFGGKAAKKLLQSARHYSHEMECYAVNKYMDDCIRFSNVIRKRRKKEKKAYRWLFFRFRFQVIKQMPRAIIKDLLPKEKIHGYLHEIIRN